MLTIVCVLRSGGEYDAEYVERLRDGVAANLTIPHRFVCLSDVEVPCERIPLVTNWPGWLAKLEIFRPNLFDWPVVYFDLDTVIVGSLDFLRVLPFRFGMLSDFYVLAQPASGMMAWNSGYSHIFTRFEDGLVGQYKGYSPFRGDAGWIIQNVGHAPSRLQDVFPGKIVSYKADYVAKRGVPSGASVVCFHGRPRPRDISWNVARSSAPARV